MNCFLNERKKWKDRSKNLITTNHRKSGESKNNLKLNGRERVGDFRIYEKSAVCHLKDLTTFFLNERNYARNGKIGQK